MYFNTYVKCNFLLAFSLNRCLMLMKCHDIITANKKHNKEKVPSSICCRQVTPLFFTFCGGVAVSGST